MVIDPHKSKSEDRLLWEIYGKQVMPERNTACHVHYLAGITCFNKYFIDDKWHRKDHCSESCGLQSEAAAFFEEVQQDQKHADHGRTAAGKHERIDEYHHHDNDLP